MSFLDPITSRGPATELQTNTSNPVNVGQASPPNPGEVLVAIDATHAEWQPSSEVGGAANALATSSGSVNVSAAAPPVAGQVLMAIDAEHAQWKVPGLHYDSAVRYWVETAGEATIEPGTWGFVYQTPVGSSGVTVFVVSSLTSPPVDSRIGLYVSPSVAVPVTVSLIGASQIMGLDGVLASSITLRPGAMYEWVFYHEDSVAIWGLVSDTAHVAKAIATTGEAVTVSAAAPPAAGHVLRASSPTTAVWEALDTIRITDYGAVGDGVADDTTAIQDAVNAAIAQGKALYVPPGTYRVTDEILLSGVITIQGAGYKSELHQSNAAKNLFTTTGDVSYSIFASMRWTGAGAGTGSPSMAFAGWAAGANVLIRFHDLEVVQFPQCAIYLPDSFCCAIDSCLIRYCGTVGTIAGGNALACSDSYGGGIRYGKITFTGSACTGNSLHNSYIANCGRGVYVDGNERVVSHGFLNTKVELCYIGIDIDGRDSSTTISRSNWMGADTYFEANKFAGATMGEGTMINTYRNDTTPGTGLPGSWSTAGPDGVQFAGRFTALSDASVLIGNRAATKPIALAVDKTTATNVVSALRVLNTGALVLTAGSDAADTTEVALYSGSGSPEASVSAQTGSLYLRHNGTDGSNTLYIKVSGDGTNTGWLALGPQFGTTAGRPAATADNKGLLYYDTDILRVVVSNGAGVWREYNGLSSVTDTLAAIPGQKEGASYWATDINAELVSDGSVWRQKYVAPVFVAAADGGTTTIAARGGTVVSTTTTTIAAHTVVLPSGSNAVSGDRVVFAARAEITALTVSAGAATVLSAPTTLAAGSSFEFIYLTSGTTWYRVR